MNVAGLPARLACASDGTGFVVQPDVVTRDARAGVQTGPLMLITQTGAESLHDFPRDLAVLRPSR